MIDACHDCIYIIFRLACLNQNQILLMLIIFFSSLKRIRSGGETAITRQCLKV